MAIRLSQGSVNPIVLAESADRAEDQAGVSGAQLCSTETQPLGGPWPPVSTTTSALATRDRLLECDHYTSEEILVAPTTTGRRNETLRRFARSPDAFARTKRHSAEVTSGSLRIDSGSPST